MTGSADIQLETGRGATGAAAGDARPFELIEGSIEPGLIIVCDHASNYIPPAFEGLGLPPEQLERHIAYDIGVADLTRRLAELLDVPAILSHFSRLLIDPNRGLDDPTLVMRVSDGAVVPGNARIDAVGIEERVERYYRPYDAAVRALIDRSLAQSVVPALLSIHSFTPMWRGFARPWHAGVLWDSDGRFAQPLLEALRLEKGLVVGDNEPYTGELEGDMMNRHGTRRGLAHALLEVRQDLIAHDAGIEEWAQRLAGILPELVRDDRLHYILGKDA